MRQLVVALIVSLAGVLVQAPPGDLPSCQVQAASVVGRSSSGLVQVSNLALLHLEARVPRRPMPSSGVQLGLDAEVAVRQVGRGDTRTVVPSSVHNTGSGGDLKSEHVDFTLDIPLDPAERDAAIQSYLGAAGLQGAARGGGVQAFAQIFRQHRVGRFEIECRVLDAGRNIGVARVNLEVLYKGRFFDQEAFRIK